MLTNKQITDLKTAVGLNNHEEWYAQSYRGLLLRNLVTEDLTDRDIEVFKAWLKVNDLFVDGPISTEILNYVRLHGWPSDSPVMMSNGVWIGGIPL